MEGKIQYGKMRKKDNMNAVSEELRAQLIDFDSEIGWKEMIDFLKAHENENNINAHDKYFYPLTEYANFRWNDHG